MIYWIYLKLRVRRWWNTVLSGGRFGRRGGGSSSSAVVRTGTGARRKSNPFLVGVLGLLLLAGAFGISFSVQFYLKKASLLSAYFLVCLMAGVMMTLGSRELAVAEWDLEWLITLPISRRQLLLMRLFERTFFNPVFIFVLFPPLSVAAYNSGWGWFSPVLGLLLSAPLFCIGGVAQTICDTGLRVWLKSSTIKNLQAVFSISSMLFFYGAMPRGPEIPPVIKFVSDQLAPVLSFLPTGFASEVIMHRSWLSCLELVLETVFVVAAGLSLLLWLLRNGVVAGSGQISGPRNSVRASLAGSAGGWAWPPMLWKEFKLLLRDRNYAVQTLVTPILVLGMQVYFGNSRAFTTGAGLNVIAVSGFGMASYAMVFSAFNILNGEGAALWLWFTFPRSLKGMIFEKTRPWALVSLGYWLLFLMYGYYKHPEFSLDFVGHFGLAFIGILSGLLLATALGVLAFDPQSLEGGRRVHVSYFYLYMLMSAIFGSFFFLEDPWSKTVGVLMTGLVVYAFWQKVLALLPYLLDPSTAPKPAVTLSDGTIAVYGFFILQIFFAFITKNILAAFSLAGLCVFIFSRIQFWRQGVVDLPSFWAPDWKTSLLHGVGGGALAATFAFLYMDVADRFGWFSTGLADTLSIPVDFRLSLGLLTVVSAPIFEEFIYRGLLLRGLLQSFSPAIAVVLCAILFACVHPMASVAPVFVLGMVTALLARRLNSLLGPLVAHSIYNFCVLVIPWLMARS